MGRTTGLNVVFYGMYRCNATVRGGEGEEKVITILDIHVEAEEVIDELHKSAHTHACTDYTRG
jgi:hypothetical protein